MTPHPQETSKPSFLLGLSSMTEELPPADPPVAEADQPGIETAEATPAPEPPPKTTWELAKEQKTQLEGKIIGWNKGGFHVVIDGTTAFCPRSEIAAEDAAEPSTYVDRRLPFRVLRVQDKGRRIVVSHAVIARRERQKRVTELRKSLKLGDVVKGKVASLVEFGAFVDLGGLQGLIHISELSRQRVERAEEVLEVGQEVEAKIIKLESKGNRISLSLKELEPDPWKDVKQRYPAGQVVSAKVIESSMLGAVVELEPEISGFLSKKVMVIPPDSSAARAYPPGKEVRVVVTGIDTRRHKVALTLEGDQLEGSRQDFKEFKHRDADSSSFNALADALKKLKPSG